MRERKGFGFFALFLSQTRGAFFNNFFSLESGLQQKGVVVVIIVYF
jgi:hypothetical protein